MSQVTIISGVERRRSWSPEQKRALVAAAFAPGARVSEVAARANVRMSQLYRWRRGFAEAARSGGFAPVVVERGLSQASSSALVIELEGAVVRVMADTPPGLVSAALMALRR